jgi:hypothetical protein
VIRASIAASRPTGDWALGQFSGFTVPGAAGAEGATDSAEHAERAKAAKTAVAGFKKECIMTNFPPIVLRLSYLCLQLYQQLLFCAALKCHCATYYDP